MKIEWVDRENGDRHEIQFENEKEATKFIRGLEDGNAKTIIITKNTKKVFITIMMWGGTLEEVKAFETREKADDYKGRKDKDYGQDSDYEGVQIFERFLE